MQPCSAHNHRVAGHFDMQNLLWMSSSQQHVFPRNPRSYHAQKQELTGFVLD